MASHLSLTIMKSKEVESLTYYVIFILQFSEGRNKKIKKNICRIILKIYRNKQYRLKKYT